jgi:diguanylate cyclase (GGDEF)-like protein
VLFLDRLQQALATARRQHTKVALMFVDLDRFKAVNDTHGHLAGDELLRRFGALLNGSTREGVDTVVRYGGEEFLVILPETDLAGAADLAERLRAAFAAERIVADGVELMATASFGVVGADFGADPPLPLLPPLPPLTPRAMIAVADALMYEAKRGGRNRVRARALADAIIDQVG